MRRVRVVWGNKKVSTGKYIVERGLENDKDNGYNSIYDKFETSTPMKLKGKWVQKKISQDNDMYSEQRGHKWGDDKVWGKIIRKKIKKIGKKSG